MEANFSPEMFKGVLNVFVSDLYLKGNLNSVLISFCCWYSYKIQKICSSVLSSKTKQN